MTYTFTRTQLETIEQVLNEVIITEAQTMYDKLLVSLLYKFWKRANFKLLDFKKKYSVVIDRDTQMAIYLYFEKRPFIPSYTSMLLKSICEHVDKEYA